MPEQNESTESRKPIEAVVLHDIKLTLSAKIIDDPDWPIGKTFVLYLDSGFKSSVFLDKIWGLAGPHLLRLWIEETDDSGLIIKSHLTYSGSYTVWWLEQN